MAKPAPGLLPEERTTVGGTFEVVGTDFAGPIRYKRKQKKKEKRIWQYSPTVFLEPYI